MLLKADMLEDTRSKRPFLWPLALLFTDFVF